MKTQHTNGPEVYSTSKTCICENRIEAFYSIDEKQKRLTIEGAWWKIQSWPNVVRCYKCNKRHFLHTFKRNQ